MLSGHFWTTFSKQQLRSTSTVNVRPSKELHWCLMNCSFTCPTTSHLHIIKKIPIFCKDLLFFGVLSENRKQQTCLYKAFCMRWLRKNVLEICNWFLQDEMLLGVCIGSYSGVPQNNNYNFHFLLEGARPFSTKMIPKTGWKQFFRFGFLFFRMQK